MSDYLGNLITRTLSQETTVRPRLPSLFEGAPGNHSSGLGLERDLTGYTAPPLFPAPTYYPAPATPPAKPEPSQPTNPLPTHPSTNHAAPERILARAENPKIERHRGSSPDNTIQASSNKPVIPDSNPIRAESKAGSIADDSRKDFSPNEQIKTHASDPTASDATFSIVPRSIEGTPSGDRHKSVVRKNVRAVEAVVPPSYSASQISTPLSPTTEPTINVTIGRVEIRATSSPTASQKTQPKSGKVLSLESYLRQRAKGDRR